MAYTRNEIERALALTICNPYPYLIVIGEKPIENRTQRYGYRGPLFIHAGKSREWLDDGDEARYPEMVFSAIVGVARVTDCLPVDALPTHLARNEHANGPWCLVLNDVIRLSRPVACSGAQGLWRPEPQIVAAVCEQLEAA